MQKKNEFLTISIIFRLFTIFNEPDEKCLLQKFFDHILDIKPHIFVTYNGIVFYK